MSSLRLAVGLDVSCIQALPAALDEALGNGFDFIAAPIFHPRLQRDAIGISDARTSAATIVAKISTWIDLDADSQSTRLASEKAFKQEVAWASHLGEAAVPAVMIAPPRFDCANYAMHVNQSLAAGSQLFYWITVPTMYDTEGFTPAYPAFQTTVTAAPVLIPAVAGPAADAHQLALASQTTEPALDAAIPPPLATRVRADPWEAWNTFRTLTDYNPRLAVVLEITADLPSEAVLAKWLGEPIKAAIIPTSIFVMNAKGYPMLPPAHRAFVQQLYLHKAQFLLKGVPQQTDPVSASTTTTASSMKTTITGATGGGDAWRAYKKYIEHIISRIPAPSEKDEFESAYYDYLQAPLQPLMDNLESQIYEVFERDPIKYQLYELAVKRALENTPADKTSVVMVVGAGRGPIVTRVLNAAAEADRNVKVYAVEKNPNAVITLRSLVATTWGVRVTVVASDMRVWDPPEKADILVSELLGSFGDNELSPECLDGAQSFLKEDGISIPQSYTSFLAPVMSSKLWNEVKDFKEPKWFETPFVVKLHNFCELAKPQPVFTFVHPNRASVIDNRRYACLRFTANTSGVIHGFSGYFECVLYDDVLMSINPETHSPGMFSWFPIFIPLKDPVYVHEGQCIEVRMWRCISSRKVWYEWALTSPDVTAIHNPQGRSYWIGL